MRRFSFLLLFSVVLLSFPLPLTQAQSCGNAPQPRLIIGDVGHVAFSTGDPLNMREAASRSAARVARLPEGSTFTVLDGPTCAGDINWWLIEWDGGEGWIAEGADGEYFVAPGALSGTPEGKTIDVDALRKASTPDDDCGALPSRAGNIGYVEPMPGIVMVATSYSRTATLQAGQWLSVFGGPVCRDGNVWISAENYEFSGELPETLDGEYVMQPFVFEPDPPVALDVPMAEPVISNPSLPLPTSAPDERVVAGPFSEWTWTGDNDPTQLVLPKSYQGDLPALPINLDTVHFVADANLTGEQLALLAQNGFVVVPGGLMQFDTVYRSDENWDHTQGRADFITTDALLHSLYIVYENALKSLELEHFYGYAVAWIGESFKAANDQYLAAVGTPLEEAARRAAVYYGVPLHLLQSGIETYQGAWYVEVPPAFYLDQADSEVLREIASIARMIEAADEVADLSIMEDYEEDFTQYKPRSYYTGSPTLSAYFRAMMWLGRITFRTKSQEDTLTGLLVLKAWRDSPVTSFWQTMDETLAWLVGPVDDLGPLELLLVAEEIFGPKWLPETLQDPANLTAYIDTLNTLPGPQINSMPLPIGITEDGLDEFTRGFRTFGQRFTFDGYVMQNLIYPAVGDREHSRALPMGEDVAAVFGSDLAFVETDEAGATTYLNYTDNVARLRAEINDISAEGWSENLYGAWLHALQPLLVRDPALVPPMMQTDAWKYKDINTMLGSYTELKHATLLYAEQPFGGLGGGGFSPPVTSYSVVEPNPLVFARIAVIAKQLYDGLNQRNFVNFSADTYLVASVASAANSLSNLASDLAEVARKEIAGEAVSEDEYYWLQESFGTWLWSIRITIEELIPDSPERMALIADIASNPSAESIYYMATGDADLIYVVTNSPLGLQVTRGAVYSTYQFEGPYDTRLTDDDWRERVASGDLPPLPSWTAAYRTD